ncbi:DUF2336 domain-containing protein [Lutibaculum baratangense]|nr:DUF2336 domain-containing protein [Lutibaculum baratangense]
MSMLVRRFLDRLAQGSPEERAEIVRALARVYVEVELDDEQRTDIERTFLVILDDPAPRVRRALAQAIAPASRAPRSLVRALLADRPDIAEPLLRSSPLLADEDLVALVDGFDEAQRMAVAGRPHVGVPLSAALIEVSGPRCCLALLENPGAMIASSSFRRLVERHRRDGSVRNALLERDDLPPVLRQMLVDGLSEELQESPLILAYLSRDKTRRILSDARDKAAVELAGSCGEKALRQHVAALHDADRLGPTVLIRALAGGNLPLVAEALSLLADLPLRRVQALLQDPSDASLRSIWRRAGLPAFALPPFTRLLQACQRGARPGEADVEAALHLCRDAVEEGSEMVRHALSRLAHEHALMAARAGTGGYFHAA